MATQVAPLETDEKTTKPGRRSSRTKEQEPEQVVSPEPAAASTIQGADPQQELDALENQAEAPTKGSYLREKDGYDALSPEQKAVCDRDFQTHLDRRTRPIDVRDGETREDAVLRAKHEYCAARQEHTAHHRQLAKTMLASKINCLNDKYPRDSFSLLNPDVAKEFMATAFYHHAAATKGLKSFDKDVFATCRRAALREFSALCGGRRNWRSRDEGLQQHVRHQHRTAANWRHDPKLAYRSQASSWETGGTRRNLRKMRLVSLQPVRTDP